jgi:hypothetical protein
VEAGFWIFGGGQSNRFHSKVTVHGQTMEAGASKVTVHGQTMEAGALPTSVNQYEKQK